MSRLLLGLSLGLSFVLAACQTSSPPKSAETSDASAPVARWSGGTISAGELEALTYPQKKQALEQLVVQRIVEQKAKAAGLSTDAFMKKMVADKIQEPTDADMQKVYDERVKGRPGAPEFEKLKPQIAQYLKQQRSQEAYHGFLTKLKDEAKLEILLKAPRIKVAAEGPSKGPASAPVTIVEFSDFQCPFCARAEDTLARIMKDYDGKVRLVYRDFPLPMHTQAQKAAEASQCAADQGKYWEMHGKLFQNQRELQPEKLKEYAKDLGLDQAKFDKCLDSGEKAKVVEAHKEAGEAAFVNATPSFFVNGQALTAPTYEEFKKVIDEELARK
jgi:protein-disulfide isomerase